jgi:hypothetical protein
MHPTTIYKYQDPVRFDVLESGLIAYTPPSRFNDPFDMNPSIDADVSDEFLEAQCAKFEADIPPEKHVSKEAYKAHMRRDKTRIDQTLNQELSEMFNRMYGVLCCTELPYDVLMWSHYAKQHEGFAIGFDLKHPFIRERFRPVQYEKNRPIHSRADDVPKLMFIKAMKWEYEKEWRSFELLSNCQSHQVTTNGAVVTIYRHQYPKDAVTRILCGCRMSLANKQVLRTKLRQWGFSNCSLEELSVNPRLFTFDVRRISVE